MLPEKKSKKWLNVLLIYTGIVFVGLMITRFLLGTALDARLILNFFLLSLGSAVLPVVAGYFGKSLFFKIYASTNFIALAYMFVLIVNNRAPGWEDLISIVVYVYLLPVGAILGVIAEVVQYFRKRKSK
ncbi:MAG: hypothetical protein LCH34_04185 [Firmicutes bacterium]|nr:hypothetical protein [Bacillota bacterium]